MKEKNKGGRPQKHSTELLCEIVDKYLLQPDHIDLHARNIKAELAKFALREGYTKITARDFNRKEVVDYITKMAGENDEAETSVSQGAFVPIDIVAVLRANPNEQQRMLTSYNKVMEESYRQATIAIERYRDLDRKLQNERARSEALQSEVDTMKADLKDLKKQNADLTQRISKLTKYIKDRVTPEEALAAFKMVDENRKNKDWMKENAGIDLNQPTISLLSMAQEFAGGIIPFPMKTASPKGDES